jgi:hypothetical protein
MTFRFLSGRRTPCASPASDELEEVEMPWAGEASVEPNRSGWDRSEYTVQIPLGPAVSACHLLC